MIDDADAVCGLAESQRDKCFLAGRLDLECWQEQFTTLEEVCEGQVALVQSVVPAAGLPLLPTSIFHSATSSYHKTVWARLRAEQRPRFVEADLAREAFRRDALVAIIVAGFEWNASLTDWQCLALSEIMATPVTTSGDGEQVDWRVAYLRQVAELPETELRGLFSDLQWRAVRGQLVQLALVARQLETEIEDAGKNPVRVVIKNKDGTVARFR